MKPLGEYVVIRVKNKTPKETASGLILEESNEAARGTIVGVGDDEKTLVIGMEVAYNENVFDLLSDDGEGTILKIGKSNGVYATYD